MKVFTNVMKIVAALAAVAGIVYVIAVYGDKIVTWAKRLLHKVGCCKCQDACQEQDIVDVEESQPAEEAAQPEAEEDAAEDAIHAEENDFEG